MRVTLTFDNGPSPDTTPAVLDTLADRGLTATFFVVGSMLARSPAPATSWPGPEPRVTGSATIP